MTTSARPDARSAHVPGSGAAEEMAKIGIRIREHLLQHPRGQIEFDFKRDSGQVGGDSGHEPGQAACCRDLSRAELYFEPTREETGRVAAYLRKQGLNAELVTAIAARSASASRTKAMPLS